MKCIALCEWWWRRWWRRWREGACVSCFCICVYSRSACIHLDSIYASQSLFPWIGRVRSNLPHRARRRASFFSPHHLLATMRVSFSLSPHLPSPSICVFSLSLSPSAAPRGSPLNAAICLCLPPSPSPLPLPPPLPAHFSEARCSWITPLTTSCKRGKSPTKSTRWREVVVVVVGGGDDEDTSRGGVKAC